MLAHPLVAWPLWAFNLYIWHLPYLYEAALGIERAARPGAHLVLHGGRAVLGARARAAACAAVVRQSARSSLYIVAARFTSMVLGNVFIWANDPIYGCIRHTVERYGISAGGRPGHRRRR